MRIFVSYAHVDWQFVDKLADRLRRYHDVWFDERLQAGQDWWQAILERINWSECFIYVLSPESLASKYCLDEYNEARNLAKHIVPIRLQPNIELPDTLQRIQYADFSTRKFEDALADLIGDLGSLALQARVQETPPLTPKRQPAISPPSSEQLDNFEAFREAVEARQANDHETALRLFNTLVQAAPDFLPEQVADLIQHSQAELERRARRKEYDRLYKQVSLLTLDPFTLKDARQMWEGLQKDFPEIDDDPEELALVFRRIAQAEEETRLEELCRQEEETERAQRNAEEERIQLEAAEQVQQQQLEDAQQARDIAPMAPLSSQTEASTAVEPGISQKPPPPPDELVGIEAPTQEVADNKLFTLDHSSHTSPVTPVNLDTTRFGRWWRLVVILVGTLAGLLYDLSSWGTIHGFYLSIFQSLAVLGVGMEHLLRGRWRRAAVSTVPFAIGLIDWRLSPIIVLFVIGWTIIDAINWEHGKPQKAS